MRLRADTSEGLPVTTLPLPAISTDATGRLRVLTPAQLKAIDLGKAPASAADGERWAVWGAARSGARTTLTTAQKRGLLGAALLGALLLALEPHAAVVGLLFLVTVVYVLTSVYKGWMMARGERATAAGKGMSPDITALADDELPVYSLLVPLHYEREMLPTLLDRLQAFNYPTEKLEVLLLIESDDAETRAALRECDLPAHMRPITVPPGAPKTKPRALNVGLARARGEYVVVYDAEDQPDPDQLRMAVAAFRTSPRQIICYQARLGFYNPKQSILTHLFTLDYYVWYDLILQGLARAGALVPLGGTSNHFRTAALRQLGGWDPYNVTEDGDLGVRIARAGLEAHMLDSVTWEEAVAQVNPWIRQRSRWVKGYMQTYLVHMREPRALWRQLGPSGFLDFQALLGGSSLILLINPLMWLLTLAYILGHGTVVDSVIESVFPAPVYYLALLCLVVGNFIFFYTNVYACVRAGYYDHARYMILGPLYWLLMSVAAWVALVSLIRSPHYWAKTEHGVSLGPASSLPYRLAARRALSQTTAVDGINLSIVIPAYNEALRLPASLRRLKSYLDGKPPGAEVIVVDDGSSDGTEDVVKEWMCDWPVLRLVRGPHRGKGGAIRAGALAAQGQYIALADADFSMPPEEFDHFSVDALGDYDVAIASREGEGAHRYDEPPHRYVMSRVFNTLTRTLLVPGIRDTQCGFKSLRREVALDLFAHQTIEGWGFDVELLHIAGLRGYRIREVPVTWYYMPGSRVHPVRDALKMTGEVLSVHANSRHGIYN